MWYTLIMTALFATWTAGTDPVTHCGCFVRVSPHLRTRSPPPEPPAVLCHQHLTPRPAIPVDTVRKAAVPRVCLELALGGQPWRCEGPCSAHLSDNTLLSWSNTRCVCSRAQYPLLGSPPGLPPKELPPAPRQGLAKARATLSSSSEGVSRRPISQIVVAQSTTAAERFKH